MLSRWRSYRSGGMGRGAYKVNDCGIHDMRKRTGPTPTKIHTAAKLMFDRQGESLMRWVWDPASAHSETSGGACVSSRGKFVRVDIMYLSTSPRNYAHKTKLKITTLIWTTTLREYDRISFCACNIFPPLLSCHTKDLKPHPRWSPSHGTPPRQREKGRTKGRKRPARCGK